MRNAEHLENELRHREGSPARRKADAAPGTLYPYQPYDTADDEISLIDLWLVLMRRKGVVAGVLVLCVAAAALMAYLTPRNYEIRTGIEIGAYAMGNEVRPVESPDSARAKLENSYIPLVIDQYRAENETEQGYRVDVSVPQDSNLLILKSAAPEDRTQGYKTLHDKIAGQLVQDHGRKLAATKQGLEADLARAKLRLSALRDARTLQAKREALETKLAHARLQLSDLEDERTLEAKKKQLETRLQRAEVEFERLTDAELVEARRQSLRNKVQSARRQLASLEDEAQVLKTRREQLDTRAELLRNQVTELSGALREARAARRQAVAEVNGESRAMTQLMIDNEIQQNSNRLATLEERLHVDLLNEQAALAKQIADNERRQEQQREAITEAETQLASFEREHELAVQEKSAAIPELEAQYDKMLADHERAILDRKQTVRELEADLDKMLADHERAILEQEQSVAELESRLENFTETRAVAEPMRSADPVGTSRKVIVLLGLVLGLMLGVFAAFFAEFLAKAREVQRARAAS